MKFVIGFLAGIAATLAITAVSEPWFDIVEVNEEKGVWFDVP